MIVWGSEGKWLTVVLLDSNTVISVKGERQFDLILEYQYWGVYWIFQLTFVCRYGCLTLIGIIAVFWLLSAIGACYSRFYNYLYTRMVARTVKARLILPQANSLCYKDGSVN